MFRITMILVLCMYAQMAMAQGTVVIDGNLYPYTLDDNGDTLILATFDDIPITSLKIFNSKEDRRRYDKYREYAVKVYPYAVEAIKVFRQVEEATEDMKKGKRKKYIKKLKKQLKEEFSGPLKKLTRTQGKILIKMIEKELDKPLYELIKGLRGGFTATYWNVIGNMYGHDLKEGYLEGGDPIMDAVLNDLKLKY